MKHDGARHDSAIPTAGRQRRATSANRGRRIAFRLLAVLIGLSPLLVCEIVLRFGGWGGLPHDQDPYVEFAAVRPLFEFAAASDRYEIPVSRQTYFNFDSFAAEKQRGDRRVFVLGGSTVQGRPYRIDTSFTTWLEIALNAADPDHAWDVINCGGVSYASFRLTPILDEVLGYQPDLIILYTGHNEFLEDRTYAPIQEQATWIKRTHAALSRLRVYNVGRNAWLNWQLDRASRAELPEEVAAKLDYRGGFESYRRDDAWRDEVVHHFELALRRMTRRVVAAGVPLILVNPVSNLKNSPPFKTELSSELPPEQVVLFQQTWESAQACEDLEERIDRLRQAAQLDARHAGVHYQLGKCFEATRQWELARQHLLRAKDEDVCPLRMLESMHEIVDSCARQAGVNFLDARAQFERLSPGNLAGEEWLVDHVHPSIHGHQLLAQWLMSLMQDMKLVPPGEAWIEACNSLYPQQLRQLDDQYHERARERLSGLRRWAQGRAWHAEPPPGYSRLE